MAQSPRRPSYVDAEGRRIAFSGDQNGHNPQFAALIKGADILIMDHAVPGQTDEVPRRPRRAPNKDLAHAARQPFNP
jgi:ribonuclease BN (tRNA processing enzyme)